jgi:hypothetical protein
MRNLRILGLAIFAVLAMGAVAASAATAASKLTAPETSGSVILTAEADPTGGGSQEFSPTVGGGTVTCKTVNIGLNTQTVNTESITVKPVYGSCKLNNAIAATVNFTTNECEYVFSNGVTSGSTTTSTVNLNCKAGSAGVVINVTGTNCSITVPTQDVGTALIDNVGTGATRDLTLTATSANISISSTETGSECPQPGSHTGGKYIGNVTIKGFIDNGGAEGAQTGILID